MRKFLLLIMVIGLGWSQTGARISGYVKDKTTGEPVLWANIILLETNMGAATDVHGHYVIPHVPKGTYEIRGVMMGYESFTDVFTLKEGQDLSLDIELTQTFIENESIEVSAERTRFEEKVEISRINLSLREIKTAPALAEADIFRSLQLMPGVQSINDFSSALVVRGGSPDENLILLDGIEVYNPYHLGGIYSTFNADALADAEFLAGGFPSIYGNRNSSVLDITSREGNSRQGRFNTSWSELWNLSSMHGEISMLSTKMLAEGKLGNGSWVLSGRRTYFDQLQKLYNSIKNNDTNGGYYFWDMHGKIIQNLNPRNRLTFSNYYGRDIFDAEFEFGPDEVELGMDWGNYTTGLEWRWVPNSKIVSQLSFAKTNYNWDFLLEATNTDTSHGESQFGFDEMINLDDWTLKHKIDWFYSDSHTITAGIESKILDMRIDVKSGDISLLSRKQDPYLLSVFAQDKWQATPLLSIQPGIRLTYYELHEKVYAEPRIGMKYLLDTDLALKASYGIYRQFLFTDTSEEEILSLVDLWLPVPKENNPQEAQHYIVGIEKWIGDGFFASAEAYYKPYSTALTRNPSGDPTEDLDDFLEGEAESYGLELLIKKNTGKVTGWIGYTWSSLEKRIDFNDDGMIKKSAGEIYNPKYDRPHNLNCVVNYEWNSRNTVGLVITAASGQPYTPVVGKTYTQSGFGDPNYPYTEMQNITGRRNSARYPMYFRCDVSWSRNIKPFGKNGLMKFQILNVTNHFNTLLYSWDHTKSPSEVVAYSMFPIIPSLGIEFEL